MHFWYVTLDKEREQTDFILCVLVLTIFLQTETKLKHAEILLKKKKNAEISALFIGDLFQGLQKDTTHFLVDIADYS
jgi:hypothetical protein